MEDKFLVELNGYKVLDKNNPIGYVRDIHSCIGLLIHKKNNSILIHIEAYDDSIDLDILSECLKYDKDNPVLNAEIYRGYYTSNGNMSIIKFILDRMGITFTENMIFKNETNGTSVGYNYLTKDYYVVTMDKNIPQFKRLLNM